MASAFERVPGAVVEDGILMHVGNPLVEQRRLVRGEAVAPLENRSVVSVAGPDRLAWLDSITSQAVAGLAPGESSELLVLDPNGHIEHAAGIVDDGETAWLLVDSADAGPLVAWLTTMRFRMRVEIRLVDEVAVIGAVSPDAARFTAFAPAGVPLIWRDPWPGITPGGYGYAVGEHPGQAREWVEIIVGASERDRIAEAAAAGEVGLAGALAVEALRIAAWRPSWGREVDERSLPHELDWLRTSVHLSKGCYRGQETVAKVHNLGHPPRRLVAVHLDGADSILPPPGSEVRVAGGEVGVLTSVALHMDDGPIGLALVKRTTPDGDATVETAEGAVSARLETIVPPEAGAAASVPRLPRLSRRASAAAPSGS